MSLSCMLSNVFEIVMYSKLLAFMETFKILYQHQDGFRRKHSTYMTLMVLIDKISLSLEHGESVIVFFLDFSKAFDTVNHEILLDKLSSHGITGPALNWFGSYLGGGGGSHGHKIQSSETRFLGVFISSYLTWKYHINYISGKIAKGIGIITNTRRLIDKESLITLYYSFIYPYLCYYNNVWGNIFMSYLDKLYKMQKKIVRIIAGVWHSEPLFNKYEILNTAEINKYLIGRFMVHVHNKSTLGVFITMFHLNKDAHGDNTRQCNHYHIPLVYEELSKSSLPYRGAFLWTNILSCGLKTNEMEHTFLKDLKSQILCDML